MANLNSKTIASGVLDILAVDGGIDASTARQVKDGDGTGSPFYITTTKVGIGTGTPLGSLHIVETGATGETPSSSATTLVLDSIDDPMGISMLSQAGEKQSILFGRVGDNDIGRIEYDHADDTLSFFANTARAMKLTNGVTTAGAVLTLSTAEDSIVAPDVLGRINFQAPLDSGTDSDAVGASISAVAQDTFSNDVNSTALYFQTASSEDATGTDAKMVLDELGRVGMGIVAPQAKLHTVGTQGTVDALWILSDGDSKFLAFNVGGDSEGADCAFISVDNADSLAFGEKTSDHDTTLVNEWMRITQAGKIGIGTSSPDALLHISSSSANQPDLIIENTSTSQQEGSNLLFRLADTDTNLGDNLVIGEILWQGYNITGSDWETAVRITGRKDGATGGNNDMGGEIAFHTTEDGSATSTDQRMCIRHDGNVGIGPFGIGIAPTTPLCVTKASGEGGTFVTVLCGDTGAGASDILLDLDFSADTDVTGAYFARFQDQGGEIGSIKSDGGGVDFNDTSDYRLKEDLKPISDATGTINKLNVYNFKWKKTGKRRDGLLAHELQEIVPYASSGTKDAMAKKNTYYEEGNTIPEGKVVGDISGETDVILPQQVDYSKLVPLLLKSIQELSAKVEALENA